MTTPYLIQRLKLKNEGEGSFDNVLQCDYMGSAEFEFGALPKSLKRITKGFDGINLNHYNGLKNHKGQALVIISTKDGANHYYKKYIFELAENNLRLKENSRLDQAISGKDWRGEPIKDYFNIDAWWDIENDVVFTFGKKNAKKIMEALEATRDKKKSEGVEGWY